MNKKGRVLCIFMLSLVYKQCAARFYTAQSNMFTCPIYHHCGATAFEWQNLIASQDRQGEQSVRITPMYQHSVCSKSAGSYFLLSCKETISIVGQSADPSLVQSRDVSAYWLNLPDAFSGYLSLYPEQRQIAAVISYTYDLSSVLSSDTFKGSWILINAPIVGVRNNINPVQNAIRNPGPGTAGQPKDILQALNQPDFAVGRIAACNLTNNGIAELDIGFGTTWVNTDDFLLLNYTTINIPTAHKQDPRFLFSPIIGLNKHWSITTGITFELPMQPEDAEYKAKIFFTGETQFVFSHCQVRVFDLKDKPWSRYFKLRKPGETETVPAINILSQKVHVKPYCYVNLATGFSFEICGLKAQLGYTLWAHRAERIQLTRPCCVGEIPLIEQYGIAGSGTRSASLSVISKEPIDDVGEFVTLKLSDLDFCSGGARCAFVQGLHGALGYEKENGAFIGIGGYFDWPHNTNAALKQWGAWATIGTVF